MTEDLEHRKGTTARKVVEVATADMHGLPARKIADLMFIGAGLWMIVIHTDHQDGWVPWSFLLIGATDVGIQWVGVVARIMLGRR